MRTDIHGRTIMVENGWIYFIRSGNQFSGSLYYKIGITKGNIRKRLGHYRTHNPHPIIVKELIFVRNCKLFEKKLHKKFFSEGGTDWEELTKDQVLSICKEMVNIQQMELEIPDYKKHLI